MTLDDSVMVHPSALCESDEVGAGTRIWAFAHVLAGARIGRRCNLGDHVYVESGAVLGDDVTVKNGVAVWDQVTLEDAVFVGPSVVFTNELRPRIETHRARGGFDAVPTRVGRGATLGAGAVIVCGHSIGENAFVSAGAVVTASIAAHARVMGHPARFAAWVCGCGLDLDGDLRCSCGRNYEPGPETGDEPAGLRERSERGGG